MLSRWKINSLTHTGPSYVKCPTDAHLHHLLEDACFKKPSWALQAVLCFSCALCGRCDVSQALKRRVSVLPLYLVWPVFSRYCCFVFGRASRASMEMGRRAVCAQPGHLAAQRGRGRGGRWSGGSGSAGKRDIPPPLFSLTSFLSGLLFCCPPLSLSSCFHTYFLLTLYSHALFNALLFMLYFQFNEVYENIILGCEQLNWNGRYLTLMDNLPW